MVKRQKEKQYQSAREHRSNAQLRAGNQPGVGTEGVQRKLPFQCCALSLMPFTSPVCTSNGIMFEKDAIEPFLAEHKCDPVTGQAMTAQDLIVLTMDKDEEGRWQCPVLTKPFADHTKIIAIVQNPPGKEANVYSYEAYQELNVKAKNYEDLISGKKFHKKKDVLVLNDPADTEFNKLRDINSFFHIKNQRQLETKAPKSNNIRHSVTASRILDKINSAKAKDDQSKSILKKKRDAEGLSGTSTQEGKKMKIYSDDVTGVKLTTGGTSSSLTSSAMDVKYDNIAREATEEEISTALFQVMRKRKKKGYVRLHTNMGDMLLEIHSDIVPRTATNFIKLCETKKYNGSSFHRLIKNFMIQGGKPPKEAEDQEDGSVWGQSFQDEFDDRLKHNGPGILSMANAGANSNRRQFFLTFAKCEHLNRKHSVFGTVIGDGLKVLKKMEQIPTDKKDRPLESITILDTIVVDNPVKEAEELERKRIQANVRARENKLHQKDDSIGKKKAPIRTAQEGKPQIGRYLQKTTGEIKPDAAAAANTANSSSGSLAELKRMTVPKAGHKKPKTKFGNFGGW